jgi:multicomponent Na+:H+ antiporter subunit E
MALIWFGLTGSDLESWLIGLPAVVIVTWLCVKLQPASSWNWSLRAIVPFIWYFTKQSISGGWDVARRAFGVRPRIDPRFLNYRLQLSSRPAQLFFCAVVGLLPGTLVVSISEGIATVHILDGSADADACLGNLETHVAELFGLDMTAVREEQ